MKSTCRTLKEICAIAACWTGAVFAQTTTSNTVTGAGYLAPAPIGAAPGQLITLFAQGVGRALTQPVRAPSGNSLPNVLTGITVTFRQGSDRLVPILEVKPVSTCGSPSQTGCGALTAITVQIPFDIQTICPLCARPVLPPAQLFISENGVSGALIEVTPLADQIHILTGCDTVVPNAVSRVNYTGLPCPPIVTHADGSLVSAKNPAQAGEEIVVYAVGLGATNPPVPTGQIVSSAAPTATIFSLDFNFRANALPIKPRSLVLGTGAAFVFTQSPLFTGLTPGYAGLYQINFVVPQPPVAIQPCVDFTTLPPGANVVQSNLTVSVGGGFSFDGAGICVSAGVPQLVQ